MDRKTVYDWETGKFCPSIETLVKIAILGNMTVNELVYGTTEDYLTAIILNHH